MSDTVRSSAPDLPGEQQTRILTGALRKSINDLYRNRLRERRLTVVTGSAIVSPAWMVTYCCGTALEKRQESLTAASISVCGDFTGVTGSYLASVCENT